MKLNIDEQLSGIRQAGNAQQTGHAQTASPLSSFALAKGAGAGAGRVQDVIAVDLRSSAFGTNAYAEKKRSAQDVAEEMSQAQELLAVQRDQMTVLSNTLSAEDYQRAQEDGFQIGEMEPGETVTIMDRIKTAMIRSGNEVVGFTDDIDRETLTEITGSAAYANALENSFAANDLPLDEDTLKEAADAVRQATALVDPDDAAVKYMVENRLDPTIRNFYLAESATNGGNVSAGGFYRQEGGYLARKADSADFEKLGGQIDAAVERAGYRPEEAGEEARWIVANDLPLNEETLSQVMDVERVSFPVDVQLAADAAAAAIADGRAASEGNLADPVSMNRKAAELMQRQELEEARLYMSAEANRRLLEKGLRIDTLPMEELIKELKTARAEIAGELFPADAEIMEGGVSVAERKYTLFEATVAQTAAIRTAPAALIGAEKDSIASGTISEIADKGTKLAANYARAERTYEAVGTEVRTDLGDSIKKAFRNVDDILREMGMEESEDNARAVRILGYNSMEITREAVEEIRGQDAKLRDVVDRLKPGAVLALIRDGVNPLRMTLDELKQELDRNGQNADDRNERYAKFLYKLEKAGGITEEERQSYIGIYRLFNTLEKTGHAAIGTVLQEGAEMTVGNLLTATRSMKAAARGIDARVDDDFGGLEGGYQTPSISAQISAAFNYYSAKAHSIYENLDPIRLQEARPEDDTTLPELADAMERTPSPEAEKRINELERRYAEEMARNVRGEFSMEESEETAVELLENELPMTFRNMEGMRALREGRRGRDNVWTAMARMSAQGAGAERTEKALDEISEALDAGEHFEEIYKDKVQEMTESLDQMMEDTGTTIDLQTMILTRFQLTVATQTADRGSYDIPVQVDDGFVNLHVELRDTDGEGSLLTASVPTAEHGVLTLSLARQNGAYIGMLNTSEAEHAETIAYARGVRERFAQKATGLTGEEVRPEGFSLVYHVTEGRELSATAGDAIGREMMLRLAKVFVEASR